MLLPHRAMRGLFVTVFAAMAACNSFEPVAPDGSPDSAAAGDGPTMGSGALSIDVTDNDFGGVVEHQQSAAFRFTVRNDEASATGALATSVDTPEFAIVDDQCRDAVLEAHASCTIDVVFSPAAAGDPIATLTIAATPGGSVAAHLHGHAFAAGDLALSPVAFVFGDVRMENDSDPLFVTVTNRGGSATGTIAVTSADSRFAIISDACSGIALPAGGTCAIQLRFQPHAIGQATASVVVTAMPGGSGATAMSGVGTGLVTLTKTGGGSGGVTSTPAGIDCGGTCTAAFAAAVDLIATPDPMQTFVGWTGACSGVAPCSLALTADATVGARFEAPQRISVVRGGTGQGAVSSTPSGIACGATCDHTYAWGTSVSLTATPATGSTFAGWSGACSGMGACSVSATAAQSVVATFTLETPLLTVSRTGGGSGTVSSVPTGIACGSDCTEIYAYNTTVTLTAPPTAGSTFAGWAGACSGTGACVVAMTAARTVTASFVLQMHVLGVSTSGGASVTSTPTGIACGADCTESYPHGTSVTLTATCPTGSDLVWSGDCSGGTTCTLAMTAARSATASCSSQMPILAVSMAGTGSGVVSSTPAGINCGADCAEPYVFGTSVMLTAVTSAGSTFTGWSGACTGTTPCAVAMTQARSVTATFTLQSYALTTAVTGSGTITSTPGGIACGADCAESYPYGTTVALAATPAAGYVFTGWSGACSGTSTCAVAMTAPIAVTAMFTLTTQPLTVSVVGNGSVTSSPAGIACGADCTEDYLYGTSVTLTAIPAAGYALTGWSGACSGTSTCTLAMTTARTVTATFALTSRTLTVSTVGSGTVTSTPAGIACGADCAESYPYGTNVSLTATPAANYTFTGWSGACSGTSSCTLAMTTDRSAIATFAIATRTLTVTTSGSGAVTSNPTGISCGADCTQAYDYGTNVILTANPAAGYVFSGWTGSCSGTSTCGLSMTSNRSATATFTITSKTLTVTTSGGMGTVTSAPAGINCGADCSESYLYGTSVVLTATPATGYTFMGFNSYPTCVGTSPCTVVMNGDKTVTALFAIATRTLSVYTTGVGTVGSSPAGISCGTDCSQTYNYGTSVTISATPATGYVFSSWSFFCGNPCTLAMTMNQSITAHFVLAPLPPPRDGDMSHRGSAQPPERP